MYLFFPERTPTKQSFSPFCTGACGFYSFVASIGQEQPGAAAEISNAPRHRAQKESNHLQAFELLRPCVRW